MNDPQLLIFYGGILVIIFLIFRNLFVGLNLWLKTKFGAYLSANLAHRVTLGYLKFPYSFFTKNNSAVLLRNINSETQILSTGYLIPLLSIFSSVLVFLGVTIILTIYDPIVTFVIIIFLSLFYSCVLIITKKLLILLVIKDLVQTKKDFVLLTKQ